MFLHCSGVYPVFITILYILVRYLMNPKELIWSTMGRISSGPAALSGPKLLTARATFNSSTYSIRCCTFASSCTEGVTSVRTTECSSKCVSINILSEFCGESKLFPASIMEIRPPFCWPSSIFIILLACLTESTFVQKSFQPPSLALSIAALYAFSCSL